jgi:ABC-type Co2+ transport system permease subunit
MELFDHAYVWFMELGENYGVNPIIFGAIYVGAIPFFTISVGWLVRNYKTGKSIVLPVLTASFFFVSAYLYLIIAGKNVPVWVYGVVAAMLVYGGWSTYRSIKTKVSDEAV